MGSHLWNFNNSTIVKTKVIVYDQITHEEIIFELIFIHLKDGRIYMN